MPIVVADAYVRGTRTHEAADKAGVASCSARCWTKAPAKRSGPANRTWPSRMSAACSISHSAGGSVRVLSPDRGRWVWTCSFDVLSQPELPGRFAGTQRAKALSAIEDSERQANVRARRQFLETHLWGRSSAGPAGDRLEIESSKN